jgi:Lrp/AsnC family transcriptional regulator, regulator for asnA, asnC and gidA
MTNIDAIDQYIIEILQENGKLSNSEIAKRIGTSEATVRRRIAKLEDEDCIRIVAVADPFKLGINIMAIVGLHIDRSRLREIERAIIGLKEVRFLGVTIGGYDIIFEAWFTSNEAMLEFLSDTIGRIEGVQRSESYQILRLSKYTYDWGEGPSARVVAEKRQSNITMV